MLAYSVVRHTSMYGPKKNRTHFMTSVPIILYYKILKEFFAAWSFGPIAPNSKDKFTFTIRELDLSSHEESVIFFSIRIYVEIPMLVENGADGRRRSFELCHNIFLSNFSYSIRTYFLRSVSGW